MLISIPRDPNNPGEPLNGADVRASLEAVLSELRLSLGGFEQDPGRALAEVSHAALALAEIGQQWAQTGALADPDVDPVEVRTFLLAGTADNRGVLTVRPGSFPEITRLLLLAAIPDEGL